MGLSDATRLVSPRFRLDVWSTRSSEGRNGNLVLGGRCEFIHVTLSSAIRKYEKTSHLAYMETLCKRACPFASESQLRKSEPLGCSMGLPSATVDSLFCVAYPASYPTHLAPSVFNKEQSHRACSGHGPRYLCLASVSESSPAEGHHEHHVSYLACGHTLKHLHST
jgi:hypothetical protein